MKDFLWIAGFALALYFYVSRRREPKLVSTVGFEAWIRPHLVELRKLAT